MDAALFAKMLSDKSITDLKKLTCKYSDAEVKELLSVLKSGVYDTVPLLDFEGRKMVYLDCVIRVNMQTAKELLVSQSNAESFGLKAMESEISSSLTIENIDFNRDSVRKILKGFAPSDDAEQRISGMKKGLEYIADLNHKITEQSINKLYCLSIEKYLPENDRLKPGEMYRNDSVFIVGQTVEHEGLPYSKLPSYMKNFVDFINNEKSMNDLLKAALIHFYIGYLHPYFDGNGRMARLMHIWYLVQRGYSSALFIPLSQYVEKSRKKYYNAYTLCERNVRISGITDVTPFLAYYVENVYNQLSSISSAKTTDAFQKALDSGEITAKEKSLWFFVLSAYGNSEFSTKQLEKAYGDAAYATIRTFVMKFTKLGLLTSQKYSNKLKYHIS